jgi:hypothetical protein
MKKLVVTVAAVLALACGQDPKQLVVTEKNVETFEQTVKASDKVSPEEKRLVEGFMARRREEQAAGALAKVLGVDGKITAVPLGKTVAAIIEEQRKVEKAAADEKARVARIAADLRGALEVKLSSVGPRTKYGIWLVDVELQCRNTGAKAIRGFKGKLVMKSLMGGALKEIAVSDELGLQPQETRTVSESGVDHGAKFAGIIEPNALQWSWEPEAILFDDGTMTSVVPSTAPSPQ